MHRDSLLFGCANTTEQGADARASLDRLDGRQVIAEGLATSACDIDVTPGSGSSMTFMSIIVRLPRPGTPSTSRTY